MKKHPRAISITLTLIVAHIVAPAVSAHPLGNFTINHYAGLHISTQAIAIDYVLDMAEIPAFQEIAAFDANQNGRPDPMETAPYHPARCDAIRSELDLRLDGRSVALALDSSALEFPPGAGGLLTLRLTCGFGAPLALAGEPAQIEFQDNSYADRLGWREIVVTTDDSSLQGDFPSTTPSVSNRLTAYPDDLLSSPLNQRKVTLTLTPALPSPDTGEGPISPLPVGGGPGVRSDAFTQLITLENLTLPTLLLALAIAFVWGAMHALTPGHGKTLVGAYLVGSRGTARHALFLGLATTITHTAGVFALGAVTLFASKFIVPEQLYPWLSLLSGLLVVLIGLNLMISRLRGALSGDRLSLRGLFERYGSKLRLHPYFSKSNFAWQTVPEAAVFRLDHDHDHDHDHNHEHHQAHDHGHHHDHSDLSDHSDHSDHLDHSDHSGHTHLPPGADGTPVTWRSLLALGISGGLLPCPSALVVLLSAIALDRIGFGLVLVLAFSLGLAGVLTGIGLLLVYAGRLFERLPAQGRLIQLLPAASALFITLAGLGIAVQALVSLQSSVFSLQSVF